MATTVTLKPNAIDISGATSGTTTLQATAVAGTTTLTLPAATDTLVGKATTDTLTNKTLTGAVMNGTLGATTPSTVAATSITASTTLGVTGVATFSAGTAALPAITTTGDTNTGIFFPAADTIAFSEGGAESARIDSSGNFGLGVTPSAWGAGQIAMDIGLGSAIWNPGTATQTQVLNNSYFNNTNFLFKGTGSASRYRMTGAQHEWYSSTASGTAGNTISFTQAMTLDASGNLGIGATTPSTYGKLVVSGGGFTQLATTALPATSGSTRSDFTRILDSAGSRSLDSSISSTGAWIQSRDKNDYSVNYDLFLQPNGGNLLVGTTSSTDSTGVGFKVRPSASGTAVTATHNSSGGVSTYHVYNINATNNGYRFYVNIDGGISNYSANNVNLSDRREKTNFAPASSYLDKICAIPVQTFNYIDQNMEDDGGLTLGVVAQDVQAVAPEMVMESNWGTEEEPKMRLSIYQTDLQYALMKCIQEQQALITALTARITALESI